MDHKYFTTSTYMQIVPQFDLHKCFTCTFGTAYVVKIESLKTFASKATFSSMSRIIARTFPSLSGKISVKEEPFFH